MTCSHEGDTCRILVTAASLQQCWPGNIAPLSSRASLKPAALCGIALDMQCCVPTS
jgi:hypothetical protein